MTEKTVKTWEWMPRRASAHLGLRLLGLAAGGYFLKDVIYWFVCFAMQVRDRFDKTEMVLGLMDATMKSGWALTVGAGSDRAGWLMMTATALIGAIGLWVSFSKRGVPTWLLRRCRHG